MKPATIQPTAVASRTGKTCSEVAYIEVSSRIQEFTILALTKQSDETQYSLVVSKFDKLVVRQVSDILISVAVKETYKNLKEWLLSGHEKHEE